MLINPLKGLVVGWVSGVRGDGSCLVCTNSCPTAPTVPTPAHSLPHRAVPPPYVPQPPDRLRPANHAAHLSLGTGPRLVNFLGKFMKISQKYETWLRYQTHGKGPTLMKIVKFDHHHICEFLSKTNNCILHVSVHCKQTLNWWQSFIFWRKVNDICLLRFVSLL